MKKKTIKISELIDDINERNRKSTCNKDVRRGWNAMLESILHRTGTYEGFGYLHAKDVPGGESPGVILDEHGHGHLYPDESRIFYYKHKSL